MTFGSFSFCTLSPSSLCSARPPDPSLGWRDDSILKHKLEGGLVDDWPTTLHDCGRWYRIARHKNNMFVFVFRFQIDSQTAVGCSWSLVTALWEMHTVYGQGWQMQTSIANFNGKTWIVGSIGARNSLKEQIINIILSSLSGTCSLSWHAAVSKVSYRQSTKPNV